VVKQRSHQERARPPLAGLHPGQRADVQLKCLGHLRQRQPGGGSELAQLSAELTALAIGVLALPLATDAPVPRTRRHRAHLALADRARDEGYCLLDVLDLTGDDDHDDATLTLLDETATRRSEDLQAVLLSGPITPDHRHRIAVLADRARLMVRDDG